MAYNHGLKYKTEKLANAYYENKKKLNSSQVSKLEEYIITTVEPYAMYYIFKSTGYSELEDSRQEIRIRILEALREFDPGKGVFLTWVIHFIKRCLNRPGTEPSVRIPEFVKEAMVKINRVEEEYRRNNLKTPSDDIIARELGLDIKLLKKVRYAQGLSKAEYNESWVTNNVNPMNSSDTKIDVEKALNKLKPRDKEIMIDHFYKGYDMIEISENRGINYSKVQEIIASCKKVLSKELKDYSI